METTVKLYSLSYTNAKTYLFALLFVVGNVVLPQVCHLVPNGGLMLLPIYFFTLIAAYKYGLQVGLLTAVLSPLVNNLLFAMPPVGMLALVVIKSGLLAVAAAYAARWSAKVALLPILAAVLAYQAIGIIVEGSWFGFPPALQASWVAVPGLLLQVFGGYALLKALDKW
ncbi:MAG: ECF transporter S component [Odoribacteraceae bacterium]|jgi:hypothetical protein|nr:ECF transporter S component [Odoribacteraceae bacterium]